MLRLLVLVFIVAFAAMGIHWMIEHPGDIVINWQGYTLKTSVGVGVMALCFSVAGLIIVWSVLKALINFQKIFDLSLQGRRERRGIQAISKGLIAIGAGDPVAAKRAAHEANRFLGSAPLTLLLQAQTAQIMGERVEAERIFRTMVAEPQTHILGLRGLYVEAHRRGAIKEALSYAQKAAQQSPSASWASEASVYHACLERRWRDALNWLTLRHKQKLISSSVFKYERAALLTAEALNLAPHAPDAALTLVEDALSANPALIPAVVLCGRIWAERRNWRKSMRVLEAGWRLSPHPDIAYTYIHLRDDDTVQDKLDRARQLLKILPDHVEAHLAFAHAALKARHFASTHTSLSWLLANQPTARTYELAINLDEAETGYNAKIKEWTHKKRFAEHDPCWMADGQIFAQWLPFSPLSGRINALTWTTPPSDTLKLAQAGIILNPQDGHRDVLADVDERIVPLPSSPDLSISVNRAVD